MSVINLSLQDFRERIKQLSRSELEAMSLELFIRNGFCSSALEGIDSVGHMSQIEEGVYVCLRD